MSENDKKYVVQLATTAGQATEQEANEASIYFMKDKELTGRVETLESKIYGYTGAIKETLKNTDDDDKDGIGALSYTRTATDIPLNGSLIVKNGNNLAAYDSEGNVWLRDEVTENAATWNNKWSNFLEKPANNDSYLLTSAYTAAKVGLPSTDDPSTLWGLIKELQERISSLEAGQKTLAGVNFDINTDTTEYKLILILGDNTSFRDTTGIDIANKVEQTLQANNVGVIWLRNDSSIDLYKQLSSFATAYNANGEITGDPAIYIDSDNTEMFISSNVKSSFDKTCIALSQFALIIFIANGGDLDNANRYGSSSGNYNYIGGAVNPNSVKINVSEYQEITVRYNTGTTNLETIHAIPENSISYTAPTDNSIGYGYMKVRVPITIASSINTVYAMEASVLKLVQTAAPDSVIRVVNPITWNINGNTDTSSTYQSAKTTLLSGLKTFCTNYGYVFKEIYSINDNNRKSTMDLASKTVTSATAINNYIKDLCNLINEALTLTTVIINNTNGDKSGQLIRSMGVNFTSNTDKAYFDLCTDHKDFNIAANGNYTFTLTYSASCVRPTGTTYSSKMELEIYKNSTSIYQQSTTNGSLTYVLADCIAGDKIRYVVKSHGTVGVGSNAELPILTTTNAVVETYQWQVEVTAGGSQNNS